MAYRITKHEPLFGGCQRAAREEIEAALEALRKCAASENPRHPIHDVRKHLKKLRSLIRLLRPAIGEEDFVRMTGVFRRAANALAPARDAAVCVSTLEALGKNAKRGLQPALSSLHISFNAILEEHRIPSSRSLAAIAASLAEAARACGQWKFACGEEEAIETGFSKIYRRARKAGVRAADTTATECLHNWRQRTKEYWAVLRLLGPPNEGWIDRRAKCAKKLAILLGKDHDLAVLHGILARDNSPATGGAGDLRCVARLIESRRRALQRGAWKLGRCLYRDKPRKLANRMSACWKERRHASPGGG